MFLRVTEGDIDFHLYGPGEAPPANASEDEIMDADENRATDGGTWEANTPEDIRAFEREIEDQTGAKVTFVVPPDRMKLEPMLKHAFALSDEEP